jgi:hypothetical protein
MSMKTLGFDLDNLQQALLELMFLSVILNHT